MGLLNYSTKVPALRTAGDIQGMLAGHGAKAIMIEYDDQALPQSLSFQIPHGNLSLGYRLPIKPNDVLKVLEEQYNDGRLRHGRPDYEQAVKVAWRIIKDWTEAQMAILETQMVTMEEVFLPYLLGREGKTLYEVMESRGFLLEEGKG